MELNYFVVDNGIYIYIWYGTNSGHILNWPYVRDAKQNTSYACIQIEFKRATNYNILGFIYADGLLLRPNAQFLVVNITIFNYMEE